MSQYSAAGIMIQDYCYNMLTSIEPKISTIDVSGSTSTLCKQAHKPAKITAFPSASTLQKPNPNIKTGGLLKLMAPVTVFKGNVIHIKVANKIGERDASQRFRKANFKYPMLECS